MQTVSNVAASVMPFAKNELGQYCSFLILPKRLYQHFISFGKTIDDLLEYRSLREAFSQKDLAEIEFHNSYLWSGELYKNLRLNRAVLFDGSRLSMRSVVRMTVQDQAEYENVVRPMVDLYKEEFASQTKNSSNPENAELSWRILPTSNRYYYLIVTDASFIPDLQIRSRAKRLISECLQIELDISGLVVMQSDPLYEYYLKLLQLEVNQVELL